MDDGSDKAEAQLIKASLICFCFMIAEIIGGYLAGSLAILTDAAHLLSDLAGFAVSLGCLYLAKRKSTPILSFGFKRAEVLGALFSISLIWVVTFYLLIEASRRCIMIYYKDPTYSPVNGKLMFFIAILGLLCNVILLKVLGGHSHGGGSSHGHSHSGHSHEDHSHSHGGVDNNDKHTHSHSHGNKHEEHEDERRQTSHEEYEEDEGEENNKSSSSGSIGGEHEMNGLSIRYSTTRSDYGSFEGEPTSPIIRQESSKNLNIEAAYIHALGDFIQSIGVILAGAVIWYFPSKDYPYVQLCDPIATFLFSLLVLWSTFQVLKTSVNVLMEGVPAGQDPGRIKRSIEKIPGILESHDLHIWSLSVGDPFLSVHVVLEKEAKADVVLRRVHQLLLSKYGISHSTVQVETDEHYNDGVLKRQEDCHAYDTDIV